MTFHFSFFYSPRLSGWIFFAFLLGLGLMQVLWNLTIVMLVVLFVFMNLILRYDFGRPLKVEVLKQSQSMLLPNEPISQA